MKKSYQNPATQIVLFQQTTQLLKNSQTTGKFSSGAPEGGWDEGGANSRQGGWDDEDWD